MSCEIRLNYPARDIEQLTPKGLSSLALSRARLARNFARYAPSSEPSPRVSALLHDVERLLEAAVAAAQNTFVRDVSQHSVGSVRETAKLLDEASWLWADEELKPDGDLVLELSEGMVQALDSIMEDKEEIEKRAAVMLSTAPR